LFFCLAKKRHCGGSRPSADLFRLIIYNTIVPLAAQVVII
jgi:hypothetical protein